MSAIAESGQGAILCVAQIGDVFREPQSDDGQGDREGKRSRICEHPVAKVVSLVASRLAGGPMIRRVRGVGFGVIGRDRRSPQLRKPARPELDYDVLVVWHPGQPFSHSTWPASCLNLAHRRQVRIQKVVRTGVRTFGQAVRCPGGWSTPLISASVPSGKTRRWGAWR